MRGKIRAALATALWTMAAAVSAQTPPAVPASGAPNLAQAAQTIDADQDALAAITRALRGRRLDDDALAKTLVSLGPIDASLDAAIAALTPMLVDADQRLAQLGPPPKPDAPPESPEIAQSRRGITRFQQAVDAEIKQARLTAVEIDQLQARLGAERRRLFYSRLGERSSSAFDPALWAGLADLPAEAARARASDQRERRLEAGGTPAERLWPLALGAMMAILVAWPVRALLTGVARRRAPPTLDRRGRTALALLLATIGAATPALAAVIVDLAWRAALRPPPIEQALVTAAVRGIALAALLQATAQALLAPRRPAERLIPAPDRVARRLARWCAAAAAAAGLTTIVAAASAILGATAAAADASDGLILILQMIAVAGALMAVRRDGEAAEGGRRRDPRASRLPFVVVLLAAWLALAAAIVGFALGYLALAQFLMRELVWIAFVLAAAFLLTALFDEMIPALFAAKGAAGRFATSAIGLSRGASEQVGVLAAGVVHLALLLLAWAAIVAPFGAGASDLFAGVSAGSFVLHLGQVTISPGAIAGAIAIFAVGLIGTRSARGWLERRYLPTTRMDAGIQASLAAIFSYVGALVALVIACAYLGVGPDRIALLAGALSVGVGFGLQAVIGNFVSGLILLAERPVKVGDWIAIGDLEGDVRRVSVRATEIEMPDRSKLIVPNSDLISKTVRNVTHANSMGRIRIVLLIADAADPIAVRDLLLADLSAHADVLAEPRPAVFLSDVKSGALEFTAIAYVRSPRDAYRVKSDLLFAIVPNLRAHGVALASSAPVVNVAVPERLIEPGPVKR